MSRVGSACGAVIVTQFFTATAVAPLPPPPERVTVGGVVYPVPGLRSTIWATPPAASSTAIADAPEPSPSNDTLGAFV